MLASLVPLGSRSLMLAASTPLDGMVEAAGDTHVIYDENNCKRTDKKRTGHHLTLYCCILSSADETLLEEIIIKRIGGN